MEQAGTIGTQFQLDPRHPAAVPFGGHVAYPAVDRGDAARRLLAVRMDPALPARPDFFAGRLAGVPHCVMPADKGLGRDHAGREAFFLLCPAPSGPPLSASPRQMGEAEIVKCVLLPAAAALEALAAQNLTHRAIRPDNVFQTSPGEPIVLGPCWAAPPAALQPAAFEPPYSAMCLPCGRGDGGIADDVYALGVLILWCLMGPLPAWADEPGLLRRKLELGSMAALLGGRRLSPQMFDLLRGMLAEDPDHRPPPSLLLDPSQARTRRVAARPSQRAQRPLIIGELEVWTARELAHALARHGERGVAMLRAGMLDRWIRRMLGDSALAVRLEEVLEGRRTPSDDPRHDAVLAMLAISVLDPLAPLVWRGVAFFPLGLGPALAMAQAQGQADLANTLAETAQHEIVSLWLQRQSKPRDVGGLEAELRDCRGWVALRGPMGGVRRLTYALNPFLPCASPLLGESCVVRLTDLLPALEAAAERADRKRLPFDAHLAAFIAARADQSTRLELGHVDGLTTQAERIGVLALLARLQHRSGCGKLPRLAGWLVECGIVDVSGWQNRAARRAVEEQLGALAAAGMLLPMLHAAHDERAAAADRAGAAAAARRLGEIAREVAEIGANGASRLARARKAGRELAASLGLIAALGSGILLAMRG